MTKKQKSWTTKEIAFFKKWYRIKTTEELSKELDRPVTALRSKACQLKIKNDPHQWEEEELAFVKANYKTMTDKELGEELNRPPRLILVKRRELGLAKHWTEEERKKLKSIYWQYPTALNKENLEDIFGRSFAAIYLQAKILGIANNERWSKVEVDYLKKYYSKKPISEIAQNLNKTIENIECKKIELISRKEW